MNKLLIIRQSFAHRLTQLLADRGVDEMDRLNYLAELVGIGVSAPERWLKAESLPTSQFLSLLAKRFGVRLEWLRSGQGKQYGKEQKCNRRYHN